MITTAAPAVRADAAASVPQVPSIHGVLQAMGRADVGTLESIYRLRGRPLLHVWSAMALDRVLFDLDAADQATRTCESALLETQPGVALACARFRSGDMRLRGHLAAADALERQLLVRYRGRGVDAALAQIRRGLAQRPARRPMQVSAPASPVVLALEDRPGEVTFHARGNGHAVDLQLDTGASGIILGQALAQRLGVHMSTVHTSYNGWLAHGVSGRLGVLDTLRFGAIVVHQAPVQVIDAPVALVGLDVLTALGPLRIERSRLLVGAAPVSSCHTPMLIGSGVDGHWLRLWPRIQIAGTSRQVLLDTGTGAYLTGTRAALDEVTQLHRGKRAMQDIGGAHPFASARRAKVHLVIAGQPIDMYFEVYPHADLGQGFVLGAGVLRDMDIFVDFKQRHMCFLPHSGLR